MKTRIIKFNDHYRIQTKLLFWWNTETTFSCCSDGLCGDDPREFKNQLEAVSYINKYIKKPEISIIHEC